MENCCGRDFVRDSTNWCKSLDGIDASQLHLFSMCQAMPNDLYNLWELDSVSGKFKMRQNKRKTFEIKAMSFFQRVRPQCNVERFYTTGTQKQTNTYSVDGFRWRCNTVFEALGCYYHYCPCQEARPSLIGKKIRSGFRKRELDELRKQYIQEKGYSVIEVYECVWWKNYKSKIFVKHRLREFLPNKMPLRGERLLDNIKSGNPFGYNQGYI